MEQPSQPQVRYRINTAISVKGVITWDTTVELVSAPIGQEAAWPSVRAQALAESDALVASMKARYPLAAEKGA